MVYRFGDVIGYTASIALEWSGLRLGVRSIQFRLSGSVCPLRRRGEEPLDGQEGAGRWWA